MRAVLIMLLLLGVGVGAFFIVRHKELSSKKPAASVTSTPKTNATPQPTNGFYLGKGDEKVFVNYASPDPVLRSFLQSVMDGSSDPNAQGREIFMRICAACHQKDGDGKDGLAPPLVGSEWALSPVQTRVVRIVLNGLKGPIHVRGKDWNLAMPPWRENLNDDQVAVVLSFIRTQLGTNRAELITPEAVAAVRKAASSSPETSETLLGATKR